MKKIKLLWVEDDINFPKSIHFRIGSDVRKLGYELMEPDILPNGQYMWDTIRDFPPDMIMMDHNLEDVNTNGALLTTEIRFRNNDTPIIYYSSEMGPSLIDLVRGERKVYTSTRNSVPEEIIRVLGLEFK
jgi:DNA-binding response OmpR family regulator